MQIRPPFAHLSISALVLASIALAACGGDDDNSSSNSSGSSYSGTKSSATTEQSSSAATTGGGEKLAIDAIEKGPGQFAFSKSHLIAKAGKVTVVMTNPAGNQAPHGIEVEGNGVEKAGQVVPSGGTSTATADLKPGTYDFYCPVDDHRAEGMEGTLTVR
jgi:plastocyanin